MQALMMDRPLLVSGILAHAERYHPDREVVSRSAEAGGVVDHRLTYGELAGRARRLAAALTALGVRRGDCVATVALNTHRHLEAYYAVAGMGAVCHTVNPRLDPDQLAYVLGHAGDVALLVDPGFLPLVERVVPSLPRIGHVVVLSDGVPATGTESPLLAYEDLLAGVGDGFDWPDLDEGSAAGLCYTSGTTGRPKGVVYSHRSTVLHSYASALPDVLGIRAADVVLPVVPMFHVNAWGLPFTTPMCGAKLVLPGPALDGASLCDLVNSEAVTFTAGVPTIWHGLLAHLEESGHAIPSVERIAVGGSAVPPSMITGFARYGAEVVQGWGMTETSPLATVSRLTPGMENLSPDEQVAVRALQGQALPGVELRLVDNDGRELPWDGQAAGELHVRGPWVATGYLGGESEPVLRDGWFPTGDVATIDRHGYLRITDRVKDLIKSGGEWISSVELEHRAMDHPGVAQAAAVAVPDDRWGERPALFVVPVPGGAVTADGVRAHLDGRVPGWWLPERDRIVVVDALPLGPTGKVLKRALREAALSPPSRSEPVASASAGRGE